MSNVVEFKLPEPPAAEGKAMCLGCQYEWQQVAPIGSWQFDCPSCGSAKGVFKYPFGAKVGDLVFKCDCSCEALVAYKRYGEFWMRCMNCGTDHTEAIFG